MGKTISMMPLLDNDDALTDWEGPIDDGNRHGDDANGDDTFTRPLAVRMRPSTLDEVIGQSDALSNSSPLRALASPQDMMNGLAPSSVILTGPPGVGKTTIARILASQSERRFVELSATSSTVKDVKNAIAEAIGIRERTGVETLLFIDEIHRFTKSQQDALLPGVENQDVVFVAATTENPSYSVIRPLLSRSVTVRLHGLDRNALTEIIHHALDSDAGYGGRVSLTEDAIGMIVDAGAGDGRKTLGLLEMTVNPIMQRATHKDGPIAVDADDVRNALDEVENVFYDRNGDDHYDMASAFIKSMRGSDAQASVYWAARMLDAGEDPLFIARRVVIAAAEEVGLANPEALVVANSALQAVMSIGMPEARILLSEAILVVATSPKSNASYMAMNNALHAVHDGMTGPVPKHLRNATNAEKRANGYGDGYLYAHDCPYGIARQDYMPEGHEDAVFYTPKQVGREREVIRRMDFINPRLHGGYDTQPEGLS